MTAFDIPLGEAPPPTFADELSDLLVAHDADDPRDIAAALKEALDHIRREAAELGRETP